MELIFFIAKLFEVTVAAPVWWVATYLAAFFYPVEHDSRQDFLAFIFSGLIVIGLMFGCGYVFRSPPNNVIPNSSPAANHTPDPEMEDLKSQLQILKRASNPLEIPPDAPQSGTAR